MHGLQRYSYSYSYSSSSFTCLFFLLFLLLLLLLLSPWSCVRVPRLATFLKSRDEAEAKIKAFEAAMEAERTVAEAEEAERQQALVDKARRKEEEAAKLALAMAALDQTIIDKRKGARPTMSAVVHSSAPGPSMCVHQNLRVGVSPGSQCVGTSGSPHGTTDPLSSM